MQTNDNRELAPAVRWGLVPTAYTLTLSGGLYYLVPDGITKNFLAVLVLCIAIVGLLTFLLLRFQQGAFVDADVGAVPLSHKDLLVALVPWGPIVGYVLLNRSLLYPHDAMLVLVGWLFILCLLVYVIPRWLSNWGEFLPLVALSTGLLFSVTNMALLSNAMNWYESGNIFLQLGIFVLVSAFVGYLILRDRKILYLVCVLVFCSSIFQPTPRSSTIGPGKATEIEIVEAEPARSPDIYFLAYDSYVANETMQGYGIDNSPQERWLEDQGFTLYPKTYSVAASTTATVGRLFGARDQFQRARSGGAPLIDQFERAGYTSFGLFENGLFFQGVGAHFDVNFPEETSSALVLTLAILEGRFRHNVAYRSPSHTEFVDTKRQTLASTVRPKLVYAHSGPGHSQNSGQCLDDETQLFRQRLKRANVEMREDIAAVQTHNPDSIVIVFGDHGPYLTKNCHRLSDFPLHSIDRLDIQDRYGTFLAISAPQEIRDEFDPKVLQDLAPTILGFVFPDHDFSEYRFAPDTLEVNQTAGGVRVENGIIVGGKNSGEALFLFDENNPR